MWVFYLYIDIKDLVVYNVSHYTTIYEIVNVILHLKELKTVQGKIYYIYEEVLV